VIALSLALAPTMRTKGTYWEVPADAHPALEQGVAILKASRHQQTAREFLDFLKGPRGEEIMKRYGFTLPN
jgi:molybdate transport system substrate-binding protein